MFLFTSYFTTRVGREVWTRSSAKLDSPHQPWKVSQQGRNPSSAFQTGLAPQCDQMLMYQLHHANTSKSGWAIGIWCYITKTDPQSNKITIKHPATGDLGAQEVNEMMLPSFECSVPTSPTITFSLGMGGGNYRNCILIYLYCSHYEKPTQVLKILLNKQIYPHPQPSIFGNAIYWLSLQWQH